MLKFFFRDLLCYHLFDDFLLLLSYGFLSNLAHGKNCQLHQLGLVSEITQVVTMAKCNAFSITKLYLSGRTVCNIDDICWHLCGYS